MAEKPRRVISGRPQVSRADKVVYQNIYLGLPYNTQRGPQFIPPSGHSREQLQVRVGAIGMVQAMYGNHIVDQAWMVGDGQQGDPSTVTVQQWNCFSRCIQTFWEEVCEVCGGHGHDWSECPSMITFDRAAKDCGVFWVWEEVKRACVWGEV